MPLTLISAALPLAFTVLMLCPVMLMIFGFDKIVSYVSQFVTLKEGDYIFTGTPRGVGEVHIGDKLELFLEGEMVFWFWVK